MLRPGQQFRLKQRSGRWFVRSYDGSSAIAGTIIIGDGEFFDSNTNNTVTLDATFANNVTVQNTGANPIPVDLTNTAVEIKNDGGNPIPVSGTVSTVEGAMTYTNSHVTNAPTNVAIQVFSAASNAAR